MLAVLGPRSGCGTVLESDRQTGQRQTRGSEEEPPSRPQPGEIMAVGVAHWQGRRWCA